jgi:CHAT domain-containing protein
VNAGSLSAERLHQKASDALNNRRFDKAEALLLRARASTSDARILARIEATHAFIDYERGDHATAFARCARALALPGLSNETRGIVECQQAMLLLRNGRTADALKSFANAIRTLRDAEQLGIALINRGGVYLAQGRPDLAATDFQAAISTWGNDWNPRDIAIATHNLGYARFLMGDLIAALAAMDSSAPILRSLSPVMAATVDQDRAEVLFAAGLSGSAREALNAAARAFGRRRMHQRRGEAELAVSRSLMLRAPSEAAVSARQARRRFERLGSEAWAARAEAVELAARLSIGRPETRWLARAETLSAKLSEQGMRWAAASTRLHAARASIARGDLATATRLIGATPISAGAPLDLKLLRHEVRAGLLVQQGRKSAARAQVRAGLEKLQVWQSSFGSLDLQTTAVDHGIALVKRGLVMAAESRSNVVLFEWSERARMLASRVQPVRAPQDAQSVADLTELRAGPTPEREAELRQQIRERAWQTKGSGQVADPVTLDELQEVLDEGTALVAYVVTADRVVALVVTSEESHRHDLGERAPLEAVLGGLLPDLEVASSELPGAMATVVRTELADRLAELGKLLVEPLLGDLGDRRLVLTPSGVLAGVPWTLLPGLAGRPLTVAQSATSWLTRRATPLRADTAGLVAGPRVARAEAEVSAAASAWAGAKTLTGAAATAGAVSELACEVDVLHLAAHGKHSSENPLFSGVQLVDGPWFGYDIDQLSAVPDVVVLSACEVGRSSVRAGEELIGMTAAWLHAGARCVIASAASVSDDVAHDVLTKVHARLAQGIAPDIALAEAVPAVDAERPPAPFVCFG